MTYQISLEAFSKAQSLPFTQFDHMYVDLCDDLVAGILLSKIIYWFGKGKNGEVRVRSVHQGRHCLIKMRKDWWEDCRISERVFDRAIKLLQDKGFVNVEIHKSHFHNNERACFIFLETDTVEKAITNYLFSEKQEECVISKLPNGNFLRENDPTKEITKPLFPNHETVTSIYKDTKTIHNEYKTTTSLAAVVVSDSEKETAMALALAEHLFNQPDVGWHIPAKWLLTVIKRYGPDYVKDQVNYALARHAEALRDEKSMKFKKAKHIEKPKTYISQACEKNWAESENRKLNE